MGAREGLCSGSAPSIVVDTIWLLVEQRGCLSICADEGLCKGMTNYCPGSPHVGLEEEGAGKGGKLRGFFFACVFSPLKKKNPKPTKPTKVWFTPVVFLTINRQNQTKFIWLKNTSCSWLWSYYNSSICGWESHNIHTSYLCPPASPAANTVFQFVKPILGHSRGNPRHSTVLLANES